MPTTTLTTFQINNLKRQIYTAIISGIHRTAERVLDTSLATELCFVPRDTGFLAMSHYLNHTDNGSVIGARAPYSVTVHEGIEYPIPITGAQTVHIRAYRRKDGAQVKAHDVTYKNKRLIGFRPKFSKFERGPKIFRVISEIKPRPGSKWMERALKQEIVFLKDDMKYQLQRLENFR